MHMQMKDYLPAAFFHIKQKLVPGLVDACLSGHLPGNIRDLRNDVSVRSTKPLRIDSRSFIKCDQPVTTTPCTLNDRKLVWKK